MISIDHYNQKHPKYSEISEHWDYLYRSYMGGPYYRNGEYLRKYWGEDQAPFDHYQSRLDTTPLDNHVKTTVDVYRSFIFKTPPKRTFGPLVKDPFLNEFIDDADYNGQNIDSFMKSALDLAMVLGNVWILVDKPSYVTETAAQALELGIRGYVCMYTPQMVLDWKYNKDVAGRVYLEYIKVIEKMDCDVHHVKIWYPDMVIHSVLEYDKENGEYLNVLEEYEFINPLGYVPFVNLVPQKSPCPGIGNSVVSDVADMQKSIYNKLSELEQTIRISVHPSLVKTASTQANAGAGAIITIPDDLDPGHFPQLLQPSGSSISSIIEAINHDIKSIDKMTHLSAIRAVEGVAMSGVALQTERQLLNSMLGDIADTLEESEIKIWKIWFDWQDIMMPDEFEIEYVKTFDIRDEHQDLELYKKAKEVTKDPAFQKEMDRQIINLLVKDEWVRNQLIAALDATPVTQTTPKQDTSKDSSPIDSNGDSSPESMDEDDSEDSLT